MAVYKVIVPLEICAEIFVGLKVSLGGKESWKATSRCRNLENSDRWSHGGYSSSRLPPLQDHPENRPQISTRWMYMLNT
jgi:hypothetical protein